MQRSRRLRSRRTGRTRCSESYWTSSMRETSWKGRRCSPVGSESAINPTNYIIIIGEQSEPPLSVELSEFSLYLYIYIYIYIYIYMYIYMYIYILFIYIFQAVRRARAINARATRKRRTGRLRFNGQYNRLENGYFSSKL